MLDTLKTFVTTAERALLLQLVQYDTAHSVHEIIKSEVSTIEKTSKLVGQMDFLFELRIALKHMPLQGGKISLNDFKRAYLSTLLDNVRHEFLSPEMRATFFRDRENLQMKLGDITKAFLIPVSEDPKAS